jgi:hypothetical protein
VWAPFVSHVLFHIGSILGGPVCIHIGIAFLFILAPVVVPYFGPVWNGRLYQGPIFPVSFGLYIWFHIGSGILESRILGIILGPLCESILEFILGLGSAFSGVLGSYLCL